MMFYENSCYMHHSCKTFPLQASSTQIHVSAAFTGKHLKLDTVNDVYSSFSHT